MLSLLKFTFGFLAFLFVFHLLTKKYTNPHKLTIIFGKKGSGKTTLATKIAQKALRKGKPVYTNFYCPGCRVFRPADICTYTFPENSVIIADEGSLLWSNRRWKYFMSGVEEYFRYQRQYYNRFYILSQSYDIDLKLRLLCDEMYLCVCIARVFSWAKRIDKDVMLTAPTGEFEARIADTLKFDSLILWPIGGRILTFIPRWSIYFRSYNPPHREFIPYDQLPAKPYSLLALTQQKIAILLRSLFSREQDPADETPDQMPDPSADPELPSPDIDGSTSDPPELNW